METEGARAVTLAKQVTPADLIAKMVDLKTAAKAAAAATMQGTPATANGKPNPALPGTLPGEATVAFASAKGLFAYPVNGAKIAILAVPTVPEAQKRHFFGNWPGAQVTTRVTAVVYAGLPQLRSTLDPQCRWRVSCLDRRDGAHFGKHRPVCTYGEPVATMEKSPR